MGMLISVISNSIRSIVLWSQAIFIPSMMLGGLTFPDSFLPEVLARIGKLLPTIYTMKIYQGLVISEMIPFSPLWAVIILMSGGVLSYILANYLFCWDSQNSTRRGHPALAIIALVPFIVGSILL